MKEYEKPYFEYEKLSSRDILTDSQGTEGPITEENDGIWDLSPDA